MSVVAEERALLAAILAEPRSDGVRLIFADWLDEAGQPERAEFIRAQCRIAVLEKENLGWPMCATCGLTTGFYKYTPRCRGAVCRLRMREYYSGRRFTAWEWRSGVPAGWSVVYRRGFPAEVRCPCADWLAHAGQIVASQPIEVVTLLDKRPNEEVSSRLFGWYCYQRPQQAPAQVARDDLPRVLWDELPADHRDLASGWRWYDSLQDARQALSVAALAHGQAQAQAQASLRATQELHSS